MIYHFATTILSKQCNDGIYLYIEKRCFSNEVIPATFVCSFQART